jgi:hypothetical protein
MSRKPVPKSSAHLDRLIAAWPYVFGEVAAQRAQGRDGRDLLQLRIDMGVLQMETTGRPDGERPGGFDTIYDQLLAEAFDGGADFALTPEQCAQVDREFVQFYHRRVAWMSIGEFRRAADDADHTLALMDFSSAHAPIEEWAEMHEQYRPFVLFHRTQAMALASLDNLDPAGAVEQVDIGSQRLLSTYESLGMEDEELENDEFLSRLRTMKLALSREYQVEPTLSQQLADAIAREDYEMAAALRDQIDRE